MIPGLFTDDRSKRDTMSIEKATHDKINDQIVTKPR